MIIIDNMNQRVKKLSMWDIKLAQLSAVFLTLILVKILPEMMSVSMWWFIGLLILCAIKPVYAFFLKK